jgi:hypothetical protein
MAPLLDSGAVEKWFRRKGLAYPVEGPRALGINAAHQFLKAAAPLAVSRSKPKAIATAPPPVPPPPPPPSQETFSPAAIIEALQRVIPDVPKTALVTALSESLLAPHPIPGGLRIRTFDRVIELRGKVGERLVHVLTARSKKKPAEPVPTRVTTNQTWLGVGPTRCDTTETTIVLEVPAVPDRPGETLHAQVCLTLDNRKTVIIPVTLAVCSPEA